MEVNQTRQIAISFIDDIWNKQQYDKLDVYLHPAYIDHSLPAALPPDRGGLLTWLRATSQSFSHRTVIDDQVTEGARTILKVKMSMTHIGLWRGIQATGAQVSTTGYRFYRIENNQIIEHWAEINGTSLENQLKQSVTNGRDTPE